MPSVIIIITVLATLILSNPVIASESTDYVHMRADFLAAEQALRHGRMAEFQRLADSLQAYPLYPYLQLGSIRRHLSKAQAAEVMNFLTTYSDSPLEKELRHDWLESLARHSRWEQYLEFYRPTSNTELQCHHKWAQLKTGKVKEAYENIAQLWLTGSSQPAACDRVFNAWHQDGGMTQEHVWDRIQLAMDKKRLMLVRYLARFQTPENQKWTELWIKVHSKPSLILSHNKFSGDHPVRNTILIHGVKRLAQSDPLRASNVWNNTLSSRYPFKDDERAAMERYLAMTLAVRGRPEALSWLAVVAPEPGDHQLGEWRIRSAIGQENWDAALAWINQLDEEQEQLPSWQYWRARALEQLGQGNQAEEIYLSLAQTRSYYGFLSADRIELPYHFKEQPLNSESGDPSTLEARPGIARAHELYELDRTVDARREWYYATNSMSEQQLRQAARLAHSWGWHDRAILTMARTQYNDDLEIRFPLVHREQILSQAQINNIDPALAFAVIRQESAFIADARSHAGALGLMQVLPRTARQLAKGLDVQINHPLEILDISKNLRIGMKYLRKALNRYDNNAVLATAAYNAGYPRVNKWLPETGVVPSDLWAETIPFSETRNYVQNILAYTAIYEQRMNQKPTPLSNRMPPVSATGTTLTINSKLPVLRESMKDSSLSLPAL